MCVGPELALLGAAVSAGGTALQSRESNKNAKRALNAKNDAFNTDRINQRRFADESGAELTRNIGEQGRDQFDLKKDVEEDRFKTAFAERKVTPDYNVGLSADAPKNVVLARKTAQEEGDAITERDVGNLAGLRGYGGALGEQDFSSSEFARLFGNIRDKAGGQTRLLPMRINAAGNNAQKAPSILPTLLKVGGSALSMGSAAGAGGPGFAVPFTGNASQVVNGLPIPGTKPMFIKNPFGSLGAAT